MPRPEDRICLIIPTPSGPERKRWWYLMQPPPSVAFALQGKVAAALGDAAGFALQGLFAAPEQDEDFAADRVTMGEALALRALRRSRAGVPIMALDAEDIAAMGDAGAVGGAPGAAGPGDLRRGAQAAMARLWAVLHAATRRAGGSIDAVLLHGEAERKAGEARHGWPRPSLLHRLLLDSGLRFDGEGDSPKNAPPAGPPPPDAPVELRLRVALRDAVADGSVTRFVGALDDVLASPDELGLLAAWAVLHLWRPF